MELNIKSHSTSTDIVSNEEKRISPDKDKEKSVYSNIKSKEEEAEHYESTITQTSSFTHKIDFDNLRFPFCIVWTSIPCLTAIFPFIGHTGICNSSGIIHDFAGSYYVSIDNMAFGSPCKYVQLNPSAQEMEYWDKAVDKGDDRFNTEQHNLIT